MSPEFIEAVRRASADADLPISAIPKTSSVRELVYFKLFSERSVASAKERARVAKLPFAITPNDVQVLLEEQEYLCAVSKIPLECYPRRTQRRGPFGPSIDRIIPKAGYVTTNIRIVCNIVNFAMNEWGEDPLVKMVAYMSRQSK